MSNNLRYQWLKGENLGVVEEQIDDDGTYLVFESGRKCNKAVQKEFMQYIQMDMDIISMEELANSPTPPKSNNKTAPTQPPKKDPLKGKVKSEPKKELVVEDLTPIISLLSQTKTDKVKLNVRMEVDLPSKEFLTVLQDSFTNDIIKLLSDHLVSKMKDPKLFLSSKLKTSIKDWHKKK